MTVLLSDLRTRVLARADMTGTGFVSTSELNVYVNDSYNELFELVVGRFENQFTTTLQFTVASGDDGYTTPTSIFKICALDKSVGGEWQAVERFNLAERNRGQGINSLWQKCLVAYSWIGSRIRLEPTTDAPGTYRLYYIPNNTALVADGDSIHGDLEKWSDYIVVDSAIKCMQKEESDPAILVMQKEQLKGRIEAMAANRDVGSPDTLTDPYAADNWGWGRRW